MKANPSGCGGSRNEAGAYIKSSTATAWPTEVRSCGVTTAIVTRKMKNAEEEEFPEDRKKRERLEEPEGLPKGEECPHYPCHFKGQVCVFCYCPKYPCEDSQLGKWIVNSRGDVIWTCIDCRLIHKNRIAEYLRTHPKATINELKRIDAE